jgi:hypothetical protein
LNGRESIERDTPAMLNAVKIKKTTDVTSINPETAQVGQLGFLALCAQ